MSRRDVADVRREAVVREQRIHAPHQPVTSHLGDDRRGGDRGALLVAVDDGVFFRSMELIRELGPYAYCMVHAENQGLYMFLNDRAHHTGRTDLGAYALSHPDFIEEEAVARVVWLGELQRCPVYIVHTTTGAAIRTASAARARGARVVIETCPHYLALTIDDERLSSQGPAIGKVSPPLRNAAEREHLWDAIARGEVDLIGTDHVPILKTGATVWEERPGFAGLATMLPVLITFGLLRGRLTPQRLAELPSLNPARTFGIHSAMSCAEALRRCPQAVFVQPRKRLYSEYSKAVWAAVREVVPTVERTGMDEAPRPALLQLDAHPVGKNPGHLGVPDQRERFESRDDRFRVHREQVDAEADVGGRLDRLATEPALSADLHRRHREVRRPEKPPTGPRRPGEDGENPEHPQHAHREPARPPRHAAAAAVGVDPLTGDEPPARCQVRQLGGDPAGRQNRASSHA